MRWEARKTIAFVHDGTFSKTTLDKFSLFNKENEYIIIIYLPKMVLYDLYLEMPNELNT